MLTENSKDGEDVLVDLEEVLGGVETTVRKVLLIPEVAVEAGIEAGGEVRIDLREGLGPALLYDAGLVGSVSS